MTSFYMILGIALWIALAFWPATLAKRKGYSFFLFLILSWLVSFVITLIAVLFMKDKNETEEEKSADRAAEAILDMEEDRQ